jgi:hypothetical protein
MKLGSFYLQMHALVRELIPDIADDYRAQDSESDDETPAITLTIGANVKDWSYQTGDNSYSGGAYHYREWSVVTLYRDSDPHEVAEEIISGLCEDSAEDFERIFPPVTKRHEGLSQARDAIRHPYTSVGSYPVYVLLNEDGMICPGCARDCYREISRSTRERSHDGWRLADMPVTVFWEGNETCSHCSKQLDSAYGDPDSEENDDGN